VILANDVELQLNPVTLQVFLVGSKQLLSLGQTEAWWTQVQLWILSHLFLFICGQFSSLLVWYC